MSGQKDAYQGNKEVRAVPNAIDTLRSWMPPNVGGVSAEGWEALARVEALLQAAERQMEVVPQGTISALAAAVRDVKGTE